MPIQLVQWQRICLLMQEVGLIPESRRSPGEGHGNTFQYSNLENSMDREASWAIIHRLQRVRHS